MSKRVGILALQGDFEAHARAVRRAGGDAVEVRTAGALEGVDGLIIPGGESTSIGKLARTYGLMEPLRQFAQEKALWGTCAGMIFMAKEISSSSAGKDQPLLGIMDIVVERNAFGRQVDSFEVELDVPVLNNGYTKPFPTVFIRAPRLLGVKGTAQVLATLPDGTAVAAQQGKWLVTSFHPELTGDGRFHAYFLKLAGEES